MTCSSPEGVILSLQLPHLLPDKLVDAFEGMVDDDAFIDGCFAVRKIKGHHKPKDKGPKGSDENN